MKSIILYFFVGIVWGLYCLHKQQTFYPNSSFFKFFLAGFLNCIGWPVGMFFAGYRNIIK